MLTAGNTYTAGATGGSATHTLTEAQLPNITGNIYSGYGNAGGADSTGHGAFRGASGAFVASNKCMYTWDSADDNTFPYSSIAYTNIDLSIGGGAAHNNMPPYKVVYAWERIA